MKQLNDKFTADFFSSPTRGRPPKPDRKTGAQRQADYRARKKKQSLISVTGDKKNTMTVSISQLQPEDQIKNFRLSYPDFCLLLTSVSESIERTTDLLVLIAARSPRATDRSDVIEGLRADRDNYRLLLKRLTQETE